MPDEAIIAASTQAARKASGRATSYLRQGGEIQQVPTGVSGRDNPLESLRMPLFNEPKVSRTPIPEVLEAMDARRQKKPTVKKPSKPGPIEKTIYDDFGEPIRKVWVDEK